MIEHLGIIGGRTRFERCDPSAEQLFSNTNLEGPRRNLDAEIAKQLYDSGALA